MRRFAAQRGEDAATPAHAFLRASSFAVRGPAANRSAQARMHGAKSYGVVFATVRSRSQAAHWHALTFLCAPSECVEPSAAHLDVRFAPICPQGAQVGAGAASSVESREPKGVAQRLRRAYCA